MTVMPAMLVKGLYMGTLQGSGEDGFLCFCSNTACVGAGTCVIGVQSHY